MWLDYENNKISQQDLRVKIFRLLFNKINKNINEEEFSKTYLNYLAESSHLVRDAESICSYLHSKYKLAIITNGISVVQRNRLQKSSINQYIDYLIISEEAKYRIVSSLVRNLMLIRPLEMLSITLPVSITLAVWQANLP